MSDKKIRLLALCDSPTSATGFAQVSRNILRGLAATGKYEIDVVGINYHGDYYDRTSHPYNIYPAMPQGYTDMYGRGRILQALGGKEVQNGLKPPYDIVFTIQDTFVIEGYGFPVPFAEQLRVMSELWKRMLNPPEWFTWIGYFPVDAALKENWVTRSAALCEHPVAYCEYGKKEMMKWDKEKFTVKFNIASETGGDKKPAQLLVPSLSKRLTHIHHGVDTSVFHPLQDEDKKTFRKDYFKDLIKPDTYLVINVSRNQPRKDLARTLMAFSLFKKRVENAHLYLHCKPDDAGGSIDEMARNFDLRMGVDYSMPMNFDAGIGYPVETVNKIYNMADLCLTTTLGEGWGFITTEAMATKTPIIAPNHTSIVDIFNSYDYTNDTLGIGHFEAQKNFETLRGIPVMCGSTTSEWVLLGLEDNERVRPLTNVDDLVNKMVWAHDNPDKVQTIVNRGYEWVKMLDWKYIVKEWEAVFDVAYQKLEERRKLGKKLDTVGRNDPCPCGSGEKFKRCHGSAEKSEAIQDLLVTS